MKQKKAQGRPSKKTSKARGQPTKKPMENARPPGKIRSSIKPVHNEAMKKLIMLEKEQKQGIHHSKEEIEEQKEEVSKAFEIISWSVVLIHGGLATSYFVHGDIQKGVAALASMLSTLGAILKRNARKITVFFKKKTNKPDKTK